MSPDTRTAAYEYAKAPRMNVGTVRDRMAEAFAAGAEWATEQVAAAIRERRIVVDAPMHRRGENAEDCRACDGRTDLDYPFICDGGPS